MSTHLIKVDETYRADTENEAAKLINEAKADNSFILSKYTSVQKQAKQKGEVVDEWYRVTLTKIFDNEKDPIGNTTITYDSGDIDFE